jgi:hypothetical protein
LIDAILSLVITLDPIVIEKLEAVISGSRGQRSILAGSAGSNISLLKLCIGIITVTRLPEDHVDSFAIFQLGIIWASSAFLLLIVGL